MLESLLTLNPILKYALPAAGLLCFLLSVFGGGRWPFIKGLCSGVLAGTALLSIFFYAGLHLSRGEYLNAYEFYHYYLGSKYADEIGYTNLYNATVVAQDELGHRPPAPRIRDLETSQMRTTSSVLADAREYKSAFSPERWEEFKGDVDFFWSRFKGKSLWHTMLRDKGYNPPPVWTMIGGTLANAVPVERIAWMQGLAALDQVLMLLAVLAVWWALGHQAALLLVIFVYSHYLNSHFTLKAAFLRLDWLSALLIAFSSLTLKRPGLAGALVAFAASVRVFPVFFACGPFLVFFSKTIWMRQWDPQYKAFVLRFCQAGAVLFLASVVYAGGIHSWLEFADKILKHSGDYSGWRIGLQYVFMWSIEGQPWSGLRPAEHMQAYSLYYRLLQLGLLSLFCVALLKQRPEHVLAFGIIPLFVLTDATFYYYVLLAVPLLFFMTAPIGIGAAIGVTALFAMSMAGHWLVAEYDRGYITFFYLSLFTLLCCLWMALLSGLRYWANRRATSSP